MPIQVACGQTHSLVLALPLDSDYTELAVQHKKINEVLNRANNL